MEIAIEMTKRPNILFIHVDQMHFRAMSVYGNPESTSRNSLLSYVPDCCIACGACFTTCKPVGILIRAYVQFWINLGLRFATEFATDAHVWRSVSARLRLGQLHKSLIGKYKSFVHNHLQTMRSSSMNFADY